MLWAPSRGGELEPSRWSKLPKDTDSSNSFRALNSLLLEHPERQQLGSRCRCCRSISWSQVQATTKMTWKGMIGRNTASMVLHYNYRLVNYVRTALLLMQCFCPPALQHMPVFTHHPFVNINPKAMLVSRFTAPKLSPSILSPVHFPSL